MANLHENPLGEMNVEEINIEEMNVEELLANIYMFNTKKDSLLNEMKKIKTVAKKNLIEIANRKGILTDDVMKHIDEVIHKYEQAIERLQHIDFELHKQMLLKMQK